jgi:hypothetical protein
MPRQSIKLALELSHEQGLRAKSTRLAINSSIGVLEIVLL